MVIALRRFSSRINNSHDTTASMQVTLQPLSSQDGSSVVVDTNPQATVASLISTFCTQRGIAYDSSLYIYDGRKRALPQFSTLSSLGVTHGQTLLIGPTDNSFSLKNQWPLLIALAALLIGVIGIITISMIYGLTGGVYPYDHGVVMDAGSSKTNSIIYQWRSDKHKGTGCVSQLENCKADGGIAQMDPMRLDPVIDCAKSVTRRLDDAARPKTPLFFAATAGMRLLNLTNPDRVNDILEQLNNHLNETGLSVRRIEIISGKDEGIYGWITANFLQQTLETPQKLDPWEPTTSGALDMGGASMQIAYALPDKEANKTTDVGIIQLYGQKHNVFAHSNLCFGRDEAERRYRYLLMKDPRKEKIEDPCLPEGYTYNITGTDLFKRPCTNSTKFQLDPSFLDSTYSFLGTSQPNYCQGNVSKLLDDELCQKYKFKECFKKLDNIPDNQEYLAFATYFFTTNFLHVTKATLEEFETAMEIFCSKNITEVEKISKSKFAVQYCFNAKYIHKVLLDGFGFSNSTWKNIKFVDKIADKDVGWTLGYMIYATNFLPEKAKSPKLITAVALAISLVLLIVVVIGTAVFLYRFHQKRNSNNQA